MLCPRCKRDLEEIVYEGVTIDTCSGCEGEWLDKDEIILISKARENVFSEAEKQKAASAAKPAGTPPKTSHPATACPRCNAAMEPLNYSYSSGVIIDRCPKCEGIWLDKDELEHLQIVIEEWERQAPEMEARVKPLLEKVKKEQMEKKKKQMAEIRLRNPHLGKSPLVNYLLKAIAYDLF